MGYYAGFFSNFGCQPDLSDVLAERLLAVNMLAHPHGHDAGGDMHVVLDFNATPRRIGLREIVAGAIYTDWAEGLDYDKEYRSILSRDESIGTYGQLQCLVYDGVSLVDTLTLLLHEKEDFRYEYATQSFNGGTTQALNGYVSNFTFWKEVGILRRGLGRGLNRGLGRGF